MRKILLLVLISYSCFGQRQAMECSIGCNAVITACGATSLSTRPALNDIRNWNQFMNGEQALSQLANDVYVFDFAATTGSSYLVNLVGIHSFCVNVNSCRHVADSGIAGNGSNSYVKTPASLQVTASLNNQFMTTLFMGSGATHAENGGGYFDGVPTNLIVDASLTGITVFINDNTGFAYSGTNVYPILATGYRTTSTTSNIVYNYTVVKSGAATSTIVNPNQPLAYGCYNSNGTFTTFGTDMMACGIDGTAVGMSWVQLYKDCQYFTRK